MMIDQTARWDDIMNSAHDRAFIVAGAANADLLNGLRQKIENHQLRNTP